MTTRVCIKSGKHYDVDCRRPGKWGNPFVIGRHGNRREVVKMFRSYAENAANFVLDARRELSDKVLACSCKENQLCHVEILIEICDGRSPFLAKWEALRKAHEDFFSLFDKKET